MLYEKFTKSDNPHFFYRNIPIDFTYFKSIRDENKNLHTEKIQNQNEINQLKSQITQLQSEIDRLKNKNLQSESQNTQLQSEIDRLKNKNLQSESQNTQLQSEIDRLRNENGQFRLQNVHLQTEVTNQHSKIDLLNKVFNKTVIEYDPLSQFQGVFTYLKGKLGENIDKALQITASSTFSQKLVPQNVINYDEGSKHFCSSDIENSWICFYFVTNKIIPTKYTIKPKMRKVYPINWTFEGSNNNLNWTNLDVRENCRLMSGYEAITFDIDENKRSAFKYIRLKMNGKNSNGNTFTLLIQAFEVYGTLISL